MSNTTTRRFFLGAASALAATRVWGANDKVNVGIVGLGGRGTTHLNTYSKIDGANIVGLCDVNQAARETANATLLKNTGGKAKEFEDMRAMFEDKNVQAVSVATPNHWHALSTIWACQAGKDVYCEKPACYNIHEGLRMIEVSRETKRMVQIGSQHRSTPFKIKGMAALHGGIIGKIYMAKGLCFKRRVSIGHKEDSPIPAGVNWDLFLGPAPLRAFNELRFKYNWHWFWDTGNGDIGNQGVHEMGIARWGLGDPAWPKTAISFGGKYGPVDDQETPNTLTASFDYGDTELVFEVRGLLTGAEGSLPVRAANAPAVAAPANPLAVTIGNLFYGTEGWMSMNDGGYQVYKGESNELIAEEKSERGVDGTKLHMENFLAAVRSRNYSALHDGIENASLSAGLCHLANISYRSGHKLALEAGPKFTADPAANKLLSREVYRKPYVV